MLASGGQEADGRAEGPRGQLAEAEAGGVRGSRRRWTCSCAPMARCSARCSRSTARVRVTRAGERARARAAPRLVAAPAHHCPELLPKRSTAVARACPTRRHPSLSPPRRLVARTSPTPTSSTSPTRPSTLTTTAARTARTAIHENQPTSRQPPGPPCATARVSLHLFLLLALVPQSDPVDLRHPAALHHAQASS